MIRLFLTVLLFGTSLFARFEAYSVQSCEAFNNLKHSQNTDNVILEKNTSYTVLQKHKGQYLILVKGVNPAQRWVDEACLSTEMPMRGKPAEAVEERSVVLALSWHNAFCETHRHKQECRRLFFSGFEQSRFVLHGLWPQPKNNVYCGIEARLVALDKKGKWDALPDLGLQKGTRDKLFEVMPGAVSRLHLHEWYKHGTCYGKTPQGYFEDAIGLVEQFNNAKINAFFRDNEGKYVTLGQVRYFIERAFGQGAGKRVEMQCRGKLITELWLHLGSGSSDLSRLLKSGKSVHSRCRGGIVDGAGFER